MPENRERRKKAVKRKRAAQRGTITASEVVDHLRWAHPLGLFLVLGSHSVLAHPVVAADTEVVFVAVAAVGVAAVRPPVDHREAFVLARPCLFESQSGIDLDPRHSNHPLHLERGAKIQRWPFEQIRPWHIR